MSGPEFFQTRMGARFYEGTMPKIAEQLDRLNDNLTELIMEMRKPRRQNKDCTQDATSRSKHASQVK